jgi:hypothetical protein
MTRRNPSGCMVFFFSMSVLCSHVPPSTHLVRVTLRLQCGHMKLHTRVKMPS